MKNKKGKHRSTGKKLGLSLQWLESFEIVEKVHLGLAESCRTQYPAGYLRYSKDVTGGIKIIGHSDKGIINIFVKVNSKDKKELLKLIEERF